MSELQIIPEKSAFAGTQEFEHGQRVAKMLSSSSLIPEKYQGNIQNTMIALELANRIGISPIMVMQNLDIVKGKPSWSSSFIIAAINNCGKFSPLRFDLKGSGMEMTCYAYCKDLETGMLIKGSTVSMVMAKAEGWLDKAGSKWKTMPEQMIMYRAGAFFGRLYVPEIMMGMHTADELFDAHTVQQPIQINKEEQRILALLKGFTTVLQVEELQKQCPDFDVTVFESRKEELKNA